MIIGIFFFFSSRRRHTRCGRDWSSDVCSSDLPAVSFLHSRHCSRGRRIASLRPCQCPGWWATTGRFSGDPDWPVLGDPRGLGSTRVEKERTIRRELKRQALFERCTVVRDADLVNNALLVNLILDDTDALQLGFSHGTHLLSIRSGLECLTEVNEAAGSHRANPEMYSKAKRLVARMDALVTAKRLPVAAIDSTHHVDLFRSHLNRLCASSFLSEPEQRQLGIAIERSTATSEGRLRFGDIYDYLVRKRRFSPRSDLIQWCRAAHVLTVPSDLRIAPSCSDQDLAPHQAAFILGHHEEQCVDTRRWFQKFPRRILTEDALDALTFHEIIRFRDIGTRLGYFDVVAALQGALGSQSLDKTFVSYLKVLEEYLLAIGVDFKVELVDWQAELARRYMNAKEYQSMGLVSFGIPVILTATYCLVTQTPFP